MRTVNDFNKEYLYGCWLAEVEAAGKPTRSRMIRSAVFYLLITAMVVFAFFFSRNKSPGRRFGSFAYNSVLSQSMQSVYPQGSLVFSWAVKPNEPLNAGLVDGDDIVFLREDGKVYVHRIIEIRPYYETGGKVYENTRSFKTQGVDNPTPDSWITAEDNVIGRVIGHIPVMGNVLMVISDNIWWAIGIVVVIFAIATLLRGVLSKDDMGEHAPKLQQKTGDAASKKEKQKRGTV